jgi:hypothetical protein
VKGDLPLLGVLFETPRCLVEAFRDGNVSPGAGHRAFYRACQAERPAGQRIGASRADSASYQAARLNAREAEGGRWAITADQDAAVTALLRALPEAAWTAPGPGCGDELAEAVHTMETTTAAFRLVLKRAVRRQLALFDGPGGPEAEPSAQAVLDWHHQRGQAEHVTKELPHGVGLARVPCGEPWATAVWFRLGGIASNLVIGFTRLACPTAWARHTIATLRWTLVQVAGRIIRHAGRVGLTLVVEAETLALFRGIRSAVLGAARGALTAPGRGTRRTRG